MKKGISLLVFLTLTVLPFSCGPSAAPPQIPEITEQQKSFAIDGIMEYSLVEDADVFQDGEDFNLVIIVNHATNEEYAKELADNFVRMVKTFSEDENPGREIGTGIYNYLVGVYTPSEEEIVIGYKNKDLDHITW